MEEFTGTIKIFGFPFAPLYWAQCNGAMVSIAQNTALFALIGTYYGGDGRTTFALPDLRSRVAIGMGQGNGLTPYGLGDTGGTENVTLSTNQMPTHTHSLQAFADTGNVASPSGALLANTGGLDPEYRMTPGPAGGATMGTGAISTAGGSQPHTNIQPYLAVNYCICLNGVFPSRN